MRTWPAVEIAYRKSGDASNVVQHESMPAREASGCTGSMTQEKEIVKRLLMWLRCGASLVILIVAVGSTRAAQETTAPLAKVKVTLGEALAILHDQQMPVEQRRRSLLVLAERNLDLERMSRESLDDHWNELTPAEHHEFVALFAAFMEAAYLTQIQDYVELNVNVSKERVAGPDNALVDATVIQPHEEALPITFVLERRSHDWMVYDVSVDGVSMVANYRAQFDHVIKRQGLEQLLDDLKAKQKQLVALVGRP